MGVCGARQMIFFLPDTQSRLSLGAIKAAPGWELML